MKKATRGNGILENYLAKQRANVAMRNIPKEYYDGNILDIGCGSGFFLEIIPFRNKFGIDKVGHNHQDENITIFCKDIIDIEEMHFYDNFFDAITALAVVEHIYPDQAIMILKEAKRILKKDGILVLTTPARWTDILLKFLSKINIVSKEEIDEHKDLFTRNKLKDILIKSGFEDQKIKTGSFELGMNLYAIAKK